MAKPISLDVEPLRRDTPVPVGYGIAARGVVSFLADFLRQDDHLDDIGSPSGFIDARLQGGGHGSGMYSMPE